jgi:putative transposase
MPRTARLSIRRTLRKLLSEEVVHEAARASGAFQRVRKIDPFAFTWTLLLGSLSGRVRRLSELRRTFERVARVTIEESSFYDRFTPELSSMLSRLLERVLSDALGCGRATRGRLAAFADIMLADSTVVRLHRLLGKAFPGSRTYQAPAALKAHVLFAVTGAGKQTVKLTPERRSDRRTMTLGPWVRGKLLIVDLGYFDYRLMARIDELGGHFIVRAKKGINPLIVDRHITHRGRAITVIGERLQSVLDAIQRTVLDVQVALDVRRRAYRNSRHTTKVFFRAVGVRDDRGDYHVYLTNIPPHALEPQDVARAYALRWEIELLFRELKTHYRLAQVPSSKKHIVEVFVKASLLCLAASRALLRRVQRQLNRTRADHLPHQRWAAVFASCAREILVCIVAPTPPRAIARDVERVLLHEAVDPNRRQGLLAGVETGGHAYGPRRHHPGHTNSVLRVA